MSASTSGYGGPSPLPPVGRGRRRGGIVWPLLLILIGAVFLLQNTGYLPPTFWLNLWRLWPLVLVLAGIELLLAHRVPWGILAATAAVILVGGAIASNAMVGGQPRPAGVGDSITTELGGASQAAVTVHVASGQLEVGALPPQPGANLPLAIMTYDGPPGLDAEPRYAVSTGGVGQLEYDVAGRGLGFMPLVSSNSTSPGLRLDLNPTIPITNFSIQTGATDGRLDLSALQVNSVELSVGAATTWVRLPEINGTSNVHITGGASTITIEVPEGVAASIRHRGGLSTLTVDPARFHQVSEGLYRSPDYDSATSRVDLTLETGVTTIQVN